MIRVESITISEFRGIRDLTLDFGGGNFAICGPNGTGKSGVVDALEFALTGKVSRLSGEGSGSISLRQHGPHVDRRNEPEKARVTVKVTIPSLNKTVTIVRSLENPAASHVTPNDPAAIEVLRKVEAHPEIVLSRRELIRYVLATPGKRSDEVQALLHLDQVEDVRKAFQTIANNCEKQFTPLRTAARQAGENLLRAIGIPELTMEGVLAAANAQRLILGLSPLADLTEATSLKDGMATPIPAQPQRIPKLQALADIRAAREALADMVSDSTGTRIAEVITDLESLAKDLAAADDVTREAFYETGMEIIEGGYCPFCDTPWDLDGLKKHVRKKIDCLREASLKRKAAQEKITPLVTALGKVQTAINILVDYASRATPPLVAEVASDYSATCGTATATLVALLPLAEAVKVLETMSIVPKAVSDNIGELEKAVAALPDPTNQDAARDWLTVAQERHGVWREAARKQDAAEVLA